MKKVLYLMIVFLFLVSCHGNSQKNDSGKYFTFRNVLKNSFEFVFKKRQNQYNSKLDSLDLFWEGSASGNDKISYLYRNGQELSFNEILKSLTALNVAEGYEVKVLKYNDQFYSELSYPFFCAGKKGFDIDSFRSTDLIEQDDYLQYIEFDDQIDGYIDFWLLSEYGTDRFSDLITNYKDFLQIKGLPFYLYFLALTIDFEPEILISDNYVDIRSVHFSESGGFFEDRVSIDRKPLKRIERLPSNCIYRFHNGIRM